MQLDPAKEVLPLIGSKEGIGHSRSASSTRATSRWCPTRRTRSTRSARCSPAARPYKLPLTEENGFLPDLDAIPADVATRAKVLWLNYPNNPTGAVADLDFFERAVAFAKKYDIAICHDGPYSEVAYDGYVPVSFLQAKGAMDVGIEFHSLSKSYNMTGWRIGMAVGNPQIIDALMRVKSNLDSGVSQAIQRWRSPRSNGPQDAIDEHNAIYQRRRDRVVDALRKLGLQVTPPKASLYVWARVPAGMTSAQFAERLLDEAAVVVTPGSGYGEHGEGYVRLSLTLPDDRVDEGLRRIAAVPALGCNESAVAAARSKRGLVDATRPLHFECSAPRRLTGTYTPVRAIWRSRAMRSSIGGWVLNSFEKPRTLAVPASGLTMYMCAVAGFTCIGRCCRALLELRERVGERVGVVRRPCARAVRLVLARARDRRSGRSSRRLASG